MIGDNREDNWKCRMSPFSVPLFLSPELVELGKSGHATPLLD
jgi:hypothetical protein